MKILKFTLLCLLFSINLFGQTTPEAFNYQGVARNADNSPIIEQEINLRISILEESTTGNVVYTETHSVNTSALGLFTLQVGKGIIVSGIFGEIDWAESDHFLQVEMDATGGTNYQLIGTSQFLSVPYAEYAKRSGDGGQWNLSANRLTTETGVLIGSDSIYSDGQNTYPLTIIGEQALPNFPDRNRVINIRNHEEELTWYFNLIDNNLSFTEAQVQDGRLFLEKGGNVGIGTIDPDAKLQVEDGDVYISEVNKGVIMKSPNGQCWRYTPDDNGQLTGISISCPN